MGDILVFKPKSEQEFTKNVGDFIKFCSGLPKLNNQYEYDSNHWPGVGNFTKFSVSSKSKSEEDLMHKSILDFAKSYITYSHSTKSGTNVNFYALRSINEACVDLHGVVDMTQLSIREFDLADSKARQALSKGAAYQAGRGLSNLLKFLVNNNMLAPFFWKTNNKKPREKGTSEDDEILRQEKMPDERALMGIAQISAMKSADMTPRDIFTTSLMALLMCAPSRGSEPLYLRCDCQHIEPMLMSKAIQLGMPEEDLSKIHEFFKEKGERIEEGRIHLVGIKWYSGKGYGHENKWLPSCMYEVAAKAVKRLASLSHGARQFAKMLEDSSSFPRHPLCPNVTEDTLLTKEQAALALGFDFRSIKQGQKRRNAINQFLMKRNVPRKEHAVNLHSLNSIVRRNLPEGFPYIPFRNGGGKIKVRWSEALFAGFSNMFDKKKSTIYTELAMPTINTLNEDLAPSKKKNRITGGELEGVSSIFQRWNYGELSITSHQLRHLIDTLAAVNGMEEELRAKWAQRSDPRHNRYYDHTTAEEYSADYLDDKENELAHSESSDSYQIQVQVAKPRSIQELNTKAALTAHTTEFGMCVHSYLSEPCHKYRDCINCDEQVCEKGDDGKCERIRQRLKQERKLLEQDEAAVQKKIPGAERWRNRRKTTVERAQALLEMLENPNIEDGSIVKLQQLESKSLLDQAMEVNGKKVLPPITNYKRLKDVSICELIQPKENNGVDELDELFDALDEFE